MGESQRGHRPDVGSVDVVIVSSVEVDVGGMVVGESAAHLGRLRWLPVPPGTDNI